MSISVWERASRKVSANARAYQATVWVHLLRTCAGRPVPSTSTRHIWSEGDSVLNGVPRLGR